MEKVFKHKQLELQLAEAKMAQQNLQFNEDKEKTLTEKQMVSGYEKYPYHLVSRGKWCEPVWSSILTYSVLQMSWTA